jgi:hypothetical protein
MSVEMPRGAIHAAKNVSSMDSAKSIAQQVYEAAKTGKLKELPKEWLTHENLTLQDHNGRTPLHWAAIFVHLNQIPAHLLTQESLAVQDERGWNAFDYAALSWFQHLPSHLLTPENLRGGPLHKLKTFFPSSAFNRLPALILWSCRNELIDGKPLMEHLSPEKRNEVKAQADQGFPTDEASGVEPRFIACCS